MHRKNRTYDKLPLPLFTYELYTCGRYRVASRTPLTTPSVIAYVSGSFHTKRSRGEVERRQLELKGVEGGD
jgi:hypothetical protein